MKIQTFDGGLVTRPKPQFLELNQAVEYNNVDNSLRTLSPVKAILETAIPAGGYNYYYDVEDIWLSYPIRRDFVPYQGKLYWTDGQAPKVYDDGVTHNLGIIGPSTAPTVTPTPPLDPIDSLRFTVGTSGDLPLEETFYKFVNTDGTYYSTPQNISLNLANSKVATLRDDLYAELYGSIGPVAPATGSVELYPPEGIAYGSGGVQVYRQYLGVWRLVGTMTDPGVGPIVSLTDDTHDISANDALDETKIAKIDGVIQYVYTYYNSDSGIESVPSPISDEEEVQGIVNLTDLTPSTDPQVDKKRIYRVGGLITSFTLVAEVDNAITVFEDNFGDTEVDGRLLNSELNTPAPDNLKFLAEANAMLFGADGSTLRFTPIGKPAYWPEVYSLEFYNEITAIGSTGSGLLVFTKFKTYIVYGTGPTLLSQQLLDGEQGCISQASLQSVGSGIIWLSTDGLCISNGAPATVITQEALGKLSIDPFDSIVFDRVYYVVDQDNNIFAYDFRFSVPIFKTFSLNTGSFAVANDKLYAVRGVVLAELFASDTNASFNYTSPVFIEGRFTEDKTYKKVYVYSKGDIIINIFINDVLVQTKALSGNKSHQLQVPQDKQRGNYIQFQFSGTGEVFEYEYEVGRGHGHG